MQFDAKSILQRMRSDAGERLVTIEGTFAGDILAAVSQELARIHDQDMEEMGSRAFVTTAQGQWLEYTCADYGVNRIEGEDDEGLRARTLAKIRGKSSSGNEASYRSWALEVLGVKRVFVVPKHRGAGTVDVFVLGDGDNICAAVLESIEKNRPACVSVNVMEALPFDVSIAVQILHKGEYSSSAIESEFSAQAAQWLEQIQGGEVLSMHKLTAILLSCAGVLDVTSIKINNASQSVSVPIGKYPRLAAVTLEGVTG